MLYFPFCNESAIKDVSGRGALVMAGRGSPSCGLELAVLSAIPTEGTDIEPGSKLPGSIGGHFL